MVSRESTADHLLFFMSASVQEVYEELRKGELIDFVKAKEQLQAKIAHGDRYHLDQGEVKFQVHNKFYHYWGQRLGYECWEDEQFVREFLRDNEVCRVNSMSSKIQVGYGSHDKPIGFLENQ